MVFPFGAVISASNMIRRNNEEYEKKKESKKKEETICVKDIIVTYDDGSCCTIKHGLAVESLNGKYVLNYKDCNDEQLMQIIYGLVEIAKGKGLLN